MERLNMFTSYLCRVYSSAAVIDRLASSLYSGFITQGSGIWMGNRETSAVLEIVCDSSEFDRITSQAHSIANDLNESAILITATETRASLVNASGDRLPVTSSILATIDH